MSDGDEIQNSPAKRNKIQFGILIFTGVAMLVSAFVNVDNGYESHSSLATAQFLAAMAALYVAARKS